MFHKKEAFDVIDATDPLVVEEQSVTKFVDKYYPEIFIPSKKK